ncbi:MAG: class I SAM-dependent methyltransferase [Thermoguttaceae bacterium]
MSYRIITPRARFFVAAIGKYILRKDMTCPSCQGADGQVCDTKRLIVSLRRCNRCKLLYRTPTTTPEQSRKYYQSDYEQGYTTDMPSPADLERLMATRFLGTERDHSAKIAVLEALGANSGDKLFDYGCSWGYGSWQMAQCGYDVSAFEISSPRAQYARRHLGVTVYSTPESLQSPELQGTFDYFFSSHVLEHVPSVSVVLEQAFRLLRPGGLFVAFTPNGSSAHRNASAETWHAAWGFVHNNFLDELFYDTYFRQAPRLMASLPYDLDAIRAARLDNRAATILPLHGTELLAVARKPLAPARGWQS